MGYILFEQCYRSSQQTQNVLQHLRQRRAVTERTVREVHLRRHTAVVAMQATFEELCHAFITPFDREDLLLLRQCAESVTRAAEDVLLTLHRYRLTALPESATPLLAAVTAECEQWEAVLKSLPAYPRTATVLKSLTALEFEHLRTAVIITEEPSHTALHKVSTVCGTAADALRMILLKQT